MKCPNCDIELIVQNIPGGTIQFEGMMAAQVGGAMLGMMSSELGKMIECRPAVERAAKSLGMKMRLVEFERKQIIEELE